MTLADLKALHALVIAEPVYSMQSNRLICAVHQLIACAEALQAIVEHPRADFPSWLDKQARATLKALEEA